MATMILLALLAAQSSAPLNEALWEAARAGDTARIQTALDKGADVNAKARYDMTALIFAADKGHLDAVKLLVAKGADVNAVDRFYRGHALDMAVQNGHADVAIFLLQNGASGADLALMGAVQLNNVGLLRAALDGKIDRQPLAMALAAAERQKRTELIPLLKAALDVRPAAP